MLLAGGILLLHRGRPVTLRATCALLLPLQMCIRDRYAESGFIADIQANIEHMRVQPGMEKN